jgi:hypothetical protein
LNNITPEIVDQLNRLMLELLDPVDQAVMMLDNTAELELMCVGMLSLVQMNLDRIAGPEVRKKQFEIYSK